MSKSFGQKIIHKVIMECEAIPKFIYQYLEGELNFLVKSRFDLHLKMCKNCHEYFQMYRAAANPEEFKKNVPLPEELEQKTLDFLKKEGILEESQD